MAGEFMQVSDWLALSCSYRSEEDTTEVPVYMRGETLHTLHPQSAHSRSRSSGKGQRVFHTGALRERSTLSIQRAKKKKAGHNFKKRARQQPDVRQSFFINNNSNVRCRVPLLSTSTLCSCRDRMLKMIRCCLVRVPRIWK